MKSDELELLADLVAARLAPALISPWMDTVQAAAYLGVSTQNLEIARHRGGGPVFCKNGRLVRYHRDDLDAHVREGARRHTAEVKGVKRDR